jgi:DNA polymerase epsilon subunit 2
MSSPGESSHLSGVSWPSRWLCREGDPDVALKSILNAVLERLRRTSSEIAPASAVQPVRPVWHAGESLAVDKSVILAAVEQLNKNEDDLERESLQVISAFKVPKYLFSSTRKSYHLDAQARPLHGAASDKVAMLRERFSLIQQRIARNRSFSRPVTLASDGTKDWVDLTSLDSLRTHEAETLTVLGMLVPDGGASGWALEDMTTRVPVSLEGCARYPGLYTENCVVLAQGMLSFDGVFQVSHLGLPPPESRTNSLLTMGIVDTYGVLRTPAEWSEALHHEQSQQSSFLFFSDCHLDSEAVLARLRRCFHGFLAAGAIPQLIVLCGPFTSVPSGTVPGFRKVFAQAMDNLAKILEEFPPIAESSHIVLVPAMSDPGSANVLPRAPVSLATLDCMPHQERLRSCPLAFAPV